MIQPWLGRPFLVRFRRDPGQTESCVLNDGGLGAFALADLYRGEPASANAAAPTGRGNCGAAGRWPGLADLCPHRLGPHQFAATLRALSLNHRLYSATVVARLLWPEPTNGSGQRAIGLLGASWLITSCLLWLRRFLPAGRLLQPPSRKHPRFWESPPYRKECCGTSCFCRKSRA